MTHSTTFPDELALCVQRETQIDAPVGIVFDTILRQLGPEMETDLGEQMPMTLEARPGGRWIRDLGDDNGHLWGHVQVVKRPSLLELTGPLFMSYPAISHLQFRLTERDGGALLAFTHRAIGMIDVAHREGVTEGWSKLLNKIQSAAEQR